MTWAENTSKPSSETIGSNFETMLCMRLFRSRILILLPLAVYFIDICLPQFAGAQSSCAKVLSEPTAMGPRLLAAHEDRLSSFLSRYKEKSPSLVYRGLALPDYSPAELVKFLFGDWRYAITSHNFKRAFDLNVSKGDAADLAAEKASAEVIQQAIKEISKTSPSRYADRQALETYIGTKIENKRSSAMAAMPEDPLQSDNPNSPFFYAKVGYSDFVKSKPDVGIFVLEIDQTQKTGVMTSGKNHTSDKEYYLISHIPPTSITRFFVGFSNHWNIESSKINRDTPDEKTVWFAFSISRRDILGRPLAFEIHRLHGSFETLPPGQPWLQLGVEQYSIDTKTGWSSDSAKSGASLYFKRKYPILGPSIEQILKSLAH